MSNVPDYEYQQEVLQRLSVIEAKLDTYNTLQDTVHRNTTQLAVLENKVRTLKYWIRTLLAIVLTTFCTVLGEIFVKLVA